MANQEITKIPILLPLCNDMRDPIEDGVPEDAVDSIVSKFFPFFGQFIQQDPWFDTIW